MHYVVRVKRYSAVLCESSIVPRLNPPGTWSPLGDSFTRILCSSAASGRGRGVLEMREDGIRGGGPRSVLSHQHGITPSGLVGVQRIRLLPHDLALRAKCPSPTACIPFLPFIGTVKAPNSVGDSGSSAVSSAAVKVSFKVGLIEGEGCANRAIP